jgi:hypothetical protein
MSDDDRHRESAPVVDPAVTDVSPDDAGIQTHKPVVNKWKRRRRIFAAILLSVFLLLFIDYWAYPYGSSPGGRSFNQDENGLWLRYTWYFGEKSAGEVSQLARQLRDRQMRYAYFHVRGITAKGRLKCHYPRQAKELLNLLHHENPEVEAIGWIYAGNRRGEGEVDLANDEVRKAMVQEALWLTNECGFDGVQWDYEICDDRDPHFLELMQETRKALPQGKLLSAAVPMWFPPPFSAYGWSENYFAQVAETCDQMAVMCYDSGFYLPRSYVWLVSQQVIRVTSAVSQGNPHCRVLFGIPTYGKGFISHNPHAENIEFALRGVREGLANPAAHSGVFAGVAPFADYTTQPNEWDVYRRLWLSVGQ